MSTEFEPQRVAEFIQALGTPQFGQRLFDLLNQQVSIRQCSAFALEAGGGPICIVATGVDPQEDQIARELAEEYAGGAYNLDPILSSIRARQPGAHAVEALRWDEAPESPYRRRFYETPRLGFEAVVSAQAGPRFLYFSIYREVGAQPFSAGELEHLRSYAPILVSGIWKQMESLVARKPASMEARVRASGGTVSCEQRAQRLQAVRAAIIAESPELTMREADICSHIVLGYTTLAISLHLGITENTVATHRKRAYAKLGISSQTELFGRCLSGGILADNV